MSNGSPTTEHRILCPRTRSALLCGSYSTEAALATHLATVHHYPTNEEMEAEGDKPEDTAETNAWDAFHKH